MNVRKKKRYFSDHIKLLSLLDAEAILVFFTLNLLGFKNPLIFDRKNSLVALDFKFGKIQKVRF